MKTLIMPTVDLLKICLPKIVQHTWEKKHCKWTIFKKFVSRFSDKNRINSDLIFQLMREFEQFSLFPQYIRDNYGEDPADYNKACTDLEQLRQVIEHFNLIVENIFLHDNTCTIKFSEFKIHIRVPVIHFFFIWKAFKHSYFNDNLWNYQIILYLGFSFMNTHLQIMVKFFHCRVQCMYHMTSWDAVP